MLGFKSSNLYRGLPWWLNGKESTCQCRRLGFNPWVGKIPWRGKWQPTLIILAWEIPWTEEPGGLQSIGSQRVRHDLATKQQLPLQREEKDMTEPLSWADRRPELWYFRSITHIFEFTRNATALPPCQHLDQSEICRLIINFTCFGNCAH